MKKRSLVKRCGIIMVTLMMITGKEPLDIYASSNTALSDEAVSERETESIQESLPEDSLGMEGGSGESLSKEQDVQPEGSSDKPEKTAGSAAEEEVWPEGTDNQETVQQEQTERESVVFSKREESDANPAGSASIVGGSYVEMEEEIRYEGSAVDSIERSGGTYVAGTLCFAEPVTYTIRFTAEVNENAYVRYKAGDLEEAAPIVENTALVTLFAGAGEHLQIWYVDGEVENLFLETYLIMEQQAPEISCKRITKEDGKQYAHIVITESGEILSGIKECQFQVDGDTYTPEDITMSGMNAMPGGEEVPVQQEVDILLEGLEAHEIQVEILDNAGNSASEAFSMKALPEGVASVIVPTSFRIAIRPFESGENTQIYSDDVIICNKSDFPVDVEVSAVEVEVNHAAPWGEILTKRVEVSEGENSDVLDLAEGEEVPLKDCRINFKLRQSGVEPLFVPLTEGTNERVARFSLEAGQEGTNLQELMGQRYVDRIENPDYAIINICGDLSEGSGDLWRSEDLVVRLIFKFHRQELPEEPEELEMQAE